jgi:hypothetical protein
VDSQTASGLFVYASKQTNHLSCKKSRHKTTSEKYLGKLFFSFLILRGFAFALTMAPRKHKGKSTGKVSRIEKDLIDLAGSGQEKDASDEEGH